MGQGFGKVETKFEQLGKDTEEKFKDVDTKFEELGKYMEGKSKNITKPSPCDGLTFRKDDEGMYFFQME